MKNIFKFLMLVVVLAVIISPVLAKTGGIKVDDDASCDVNREDNVLAPNCGSVIWLNIPQSELGTYTCQICDSGVCTSCSNFTNNWSSCGDGYFFTFFTTPSGSGSRTVVLSDGSGNVGRDSFRLVATEGCD